MGKAKPKWQADAEKANIPMAADISTLQEFESVDETYPGTFLELVERKKYLDITIKEYKEENKAISDQLLMALAMTELDKVKLDMDGTILKIGNGRSPSRIIPTKLLEQGVTVDQIKAATVDGSPYSFAQIMLPGQKEEADHE